MLKKLTLALLLIIQSCSSGYNKNRDFRLDVKPFDKGDSITITKISATYESYKNEAFDTEFTEMNWCKDEITKKCSDVFYLNPYSRKKFHSQYSFYSTNPGFYYLNEIKEFNNHPERWLLLPIAAFMGGGSAAGIHPNFNNSISGWNTKLNSSNFVSFEAKPDEIVYIGDLYFTFTKQKYWIRGKINLKIEDRYDEAVAYFRAKYPEYKNRPVIKRLAQPGVLLDNFDAGIFW